MAEFVNKWLDELGVSRYNRMFGIAWYHTVLILLVRGPWELIPTDILVRYGHQFPNVYLEPSRQEWIDFISKAPLPVHAELVEPMRKVYGECTDELSTRLFWTWFLNPRYLSSVYKPLTIPELKETGLMHAFQELKMKK
jgi:hypothetical protein